MKPTANVLTKLDENIIQKTDDEEKSEAKVFRSADLLMTLSAKLPSFLFIKEIPTWTSLMPQLTSKEV